MGLYRFVRNSRLFSEQTSDLFALFKLASPLLAANLLNAVISSGIIILVARYLDPAQYGTYAVILGAVQVSVGLMSSGVSTWGVREVARDPDAANFVFLSVLKFLVIAGSIVMALGVTALFLSSISGIILGAATLLCLQIVTRSLGEAAMGVLIGRQLTPRAATANIVETLSSVVLIPSALGLGFGIIGLAFAELVASFIRTCVAFRYVRRILKVSFDIRKGDARLALYASRPFWVSQSSFSISSRLQPAVIGLSGSYQAGLFAFGQRLFESSSFAISPLTMVLMPHLTNSLELRQHLKRSMLILTGLSIAAGAGVGIALIGASNLILPRLIGSEYEPVYRLSWMIAFAIVFLFAAQVLYAYIIALRLDSFLAKSSAFGAAILLISLALASILGGTLTHFFSILILWYVWMDAWWVKRIWKALCSLESSHNRRQSAELAIPPAGDYRL